LLHSLRSLCLKGSLRSLRCSMGTAAFVESDETTLSENQLCTGGVLVGSSCRSAARDRALERAYFVVRSGTEKRVPSLILSTARGRDPSLLPTRRVSCSATPFSRLETGNVAYFTHRTHVAVLRQERRWKRSHCRTSQLFPSLEETVAGLRSPKLLAARHPRPPYQEDTYMLRSSNPILSKQDAFTPAAPQYDQNPITRPAATDSTPPATNRLRAAARRSDDL
jgi:hypothetical protein